MFLLGIFINFISSVSDIIYLVGNEVAPHENSLHTQPCTPFPNST